MAETGTAFSAERMMIGGAIAEHLTRLGILYDTAVGLGGVCVDIGIRHPFKDTYCLAVIIGSPSPGDKGIAAYESAGRVQETLFVSPSAWWMDSRRQLDRVGQAALAAMCDSDKAMEEGAEIRPRQGSRQRAVSTQDRAPAQLTARTALTAWMSEEGSTAARS